MNNPAVMSGIIHGKTIELDNEPGLKEGQRVTVVVHPIASAIITGEGLKQAFGSWAEDSDELDQYLEWNREQRKLPRSEKEPRIFPRCPD